MTITLPLYIFIAVILSPPVVNGLGSASTIAVTYDSGTVCGILANQPSQRIECYRGGQTISVEPNNTSFEAISGGRNFFCGLRSGGLSLHCWDTRSSFSNTSFPIRRLYYNESIGLRDLTVGDDHVCALQNGTGVGFCWRGNGFPSPPLGLRFLSITSGRGFSCGILLNDNTVSCWGNSSIVIEIQTKFQNIPMLTLVAGDSHVCGLNGTGFLVCNGSNDSGQLDFPSGLGAFEFSELALGANHSCAIRRSNGTVICWGGREGEFSRNVTAINGVSFELIVAGLNFTCGLTTTNLSVICWGPGWPGNNPNSGGILPKIVPGPCSTASCSSCGIYVNSQTLCSGSGQICKRCEAEIPIPSPAPAPPSPSSPPPGPASKSSKARNRGLLAFAIVGSVGIFAGICTIIYGLWTGICCCRHQKIHNSVQPTITGANTNGGSQGGNNSGGLVPLSRSSTIRRQSSRAMRRQRSGTSSKHTDRAEEFSLEELAAATNNFSTVNKIGSGSFGTVYRGKLSDGREVAIKRGETKPKKFQEKESAFDSELAFLSRLHHKHLVRLVGFCEERDERLLVYDYMKNGALYDHLHGKNNVEKSSSVLNSWKMRIKVSLDAARGIEYLHSYAVPPIIHRDIKSSNILLDANWTARVSDFGLSLMGPESEAEYTLMKAAGTVGYMDPEYYGLNVLTAKSDVYGLGVVLLEVLTGKRAIFKDEENGGGPISVVDFAVPMIMAGELGRVLDMRVGAPEMSEAEAVELVAYTAMHCVNLEGKDRPTMGDIVANLERALSLCDDSHGSISSASISIVSE